MSNLPLKALKWVDESDADVKHTAQSALHNYTIQNSEVGKKYEVKYESRRGVKYSPEPATGFASVADAKEWAWNHYNEKMQPYVKPMPTWIDASERLPESECFYLVRLFDGHRDEHVFVILWWNAKHQQFLEWDAMCEPTHWMPIPEFSTMQNLHKGGGCE